MGIFGSKETIDLSDPGEITVDREIAAAVPDAGEYMLNWLGGLIDGETAARLSNEIDSRRLPNGLLAARQFSGVPPIGRKQTPLTFVQVLLSARSRFAVSAWGSFSTRRMGRDHRTLGRTLEQLAFQQGHAAAATWAVQARPDSPPTNMQFLQSQILAAWEEDLSFVRNGDLIRAFKNW